MAGPGFDHQYCKPNQTNPNPTNQKQVPKELTDLEKDPH
jgi:hypothetical protein